MVFHCIFLGKGRSILHLTWSNPRSGMDLIINDVSNPKPVRKPAHSNATSSIKYCQGKVSCVELFSKLTAFCCTLGTAKPLIVSQKAKVSVAPFCSGRDSNSRKSLKPFSLEVQKRKEHRKKRNVYLNYKFAWKSKELSKEHPKSTMPKMRAGRNDVNRVKTREIWNVKGYMKHQ